MIYILGASQYSGHQRKRNTREPKDPIKTPKSFAWLQQLYSRLTRGTTYTSRRIGSVCPARRTIGLFAEKRGLIRNVLTTYFIPSFAPAANQLEEQLCPSASTKADIVRLAEVGPSQY